MGISEDEMSESSDTFVLVAVSMAEISTPHEGLHNVSCLNWSRFMLERRRPGILEEWDVQELTESVEDESWLAVVCNRDSWDHNGWARRTWWLTTSHWRMNEAIDLYLKILKSCLEMSAKSDHRPGERARREWRCVDHCSSFCRPTRRVIPCTETDKLKRQVHWSWKVELESVLSSSGISHSRVYA